MTKTWLIRILELLLFFIYFKWIMRWLRRSGTQKRPPEEACKLKYPSFWLFSGLGGFVCFAGVAILSNVFRNKTTTWYTTTTFIVFALLSLFCMIDYFITIYNVSDVGLIYRKNFGKEKLIPWLEINDVRYSLFVDGVRLGTKSGEVVRVSKWLMGFSLFARLLLDHAPEEAIKDIRAIALLVGKAECKVILSPKIGFLNLKVGDVSQIISQDKELLSPLFALSEERIENPPRCDVLMIYCDIKSDGSILGSDEGLKKFIQDSGAKIVVVATDNNNEAYVATMKNGVGLVNFVGTFERQGKAFGQFYCKLFREMFLGVPIRKALEMVYSQHPEDEDDDSEFHDVFWSGRAGEITFKKE